MGGQASPGSSQDKAGVEHPHGRGNANALRFSIDLPTMKLDFCGDQSQLGEVRRIIESLSSELDEHEPLLELKLRLSEDFLKHAPLAKRLQNALLLDEDVRVLKQTLQFEQEYDLEAGKATRQVNAVSVKAAISQLFEPVDGTITECFLHIRGELDREQQIIIMDATRQQLGMGVKTRFFSTRRNLEGNILLEAVCFGEDIAESW